MSDLDTPGRWPRGRMHVALHGLLLAGGRSSRLGRDKASMVLGDRGLSQAAHALGLLRSLCPRTHLSLREGQVAPAGAEGVPVLRDEPAAEGPLAGILSAFRAVPGSAWLVVACDLPFVRADLLAQLVECHRSEPSRPFVAYAAAADGLPEPLCAIYGPPAGPILARYAARGEFSPRRIMLEENTPLLDLPGSEAGALFNVNTPQDLAVARALASPR